MRKIKHGRLGSSHKEICCLELKNVGVKMQGDTILDEVSFHL